MQIIIPIMNLHIVYCSWLVLMPTFGRDCKRCINMFFYRPNVINLIFCSTSEPDRSDEQWKTGQKNSKEKVLLFSFFGSSYVTTLLILCSEYNQYNLFPNFVYIVLMQIKRKTVKVVEIEVAEKQVQEDNQVEETEKEVQEDDQVERTEGQMQVEAQV